MGKVRNKMWENVGLLILISRCHRDIIIIIGIILIIISLCNVIIS